MYRTIRVVVLITSYDQRIDVRVDKEMKLYLIGMDRDHSPYIRNLITEDRLNQADPKLIDQEIQKHKEAIEDLKEKKKSKTIDMKRINEILQKHVKSYKENAAEGRSETQRIRFIERSILPEIRKLGYKGTAGDIDKILLNWPES